MREQDIHKQNKLLADLISVSTNDGARPVTAILPRYFCDSQKDMYLLKQLIKKGFAAKEHVGGGPHRSICAYKPTSAGISASEKHKDAT